MTLPKEVQTILQTLHTAGHEAYVVGGCVRDLLLHKHPHDWDIATNAQPEEIQQLFPQHFYTNRFGTVTVLTRSSDAVLKEIEVTTYRVDAAYSDQRHPDTVSFTQKLEEDLARRDFTINAMALNHVGFRAHRRDARHAVVVDGAQVIDPFGGVRDLHAQLIRAVGVPDERFTEDALRLLRAVRFSAQLGFSVEDTTLHALEQRAGDLRAVSQERIRDELIKMVMSDAPERGFVLLEQTGLLEHILPELAEGVGVAQNKHHVYTVFEHSVKSLQFAADYDYSLVIRLAALFHDIGKPRTRRRDRAAGDYTFYGHDIVGARMTERLMRRLRFPREMITQVAHLVRHHMFYYDVGKITEAGVRRLLRRVGPEHFDDLIKLRIAERKGSGVPKARPYRLRHLQFMAEKVSQQPIATNQLAVNGTDLMTSLQLPPGPLVGGILNALLAEVLEDPSRNTREHLLERARELQREDPATLKQRGASAIDAQEAQREDDIRRKYHV